MADDAFEAMLGEIRSAAGLDADPGSTRIAGDGTLRSCFAVTELASACIAAACLAVAELSRLGDRRPEVVVDRRLASLWFGWSIVPMGWQMPAAWDALAGDYRTKDGWIKLHTNAPHHRAAALDVLGRVRDRAALADAVLDWTADALETAVVDAGGCAAALRTAPDWFDHPQGAAVSREPLISWQAGVAARSDWAPSPERPLAGVRVLDLTRVLAGPVATRFLAGYGAEVLRIDAPDWDEPGVVPEVTLGKRCARLDLHDRDHRRVFEYLLSKADILVHGYRPGALDRLGYDAEARSAIRPGLIDVSLSAYGHSGPWAGRRGFDSLVQFSSGIAAAGMASRQSDIPVSLPVQALDHATGYLMACAAVRGLITRRVSGAGPRARLSLARTAALLSKYPMVEPDEPMDQRGESDVLTAVENTSWGHARRLRPPATIEGAPMRWLIPARRLGADQAEWKA